MERAIRCLRLFDCLYNISYDPDSKGSGAVFRNEAIRMLLTKAFDSMIIVPHPTFSQGYPHNHDDGSIITPDQIMILFDEHYEKFCELEALLLFDSTHKLNLMNEKIKSLENSLQELELKIANMPFSKQYDVSITEFTQLQNHKSII